MYIVTSPLPDLVISVYPKAPSTTLDDLLKMAEVEYTVDRRPLDISKIKVTGLNDDGKVISSFVMSTPKSVSGKSFVTVAKKFLQKAKDKHERKISI